MARIRKNSKTFKSTSQVISPNTKGKLFPKVTSAKISLGEKDKVVSKGSITIGKYTSPKSKTYPKITSAKRITKEGNRSSVFKKVLWNFMFPLTVGGIVGGVSYANPALIPPAYIILRPELNPVAGLPSLVNPVSIGVLNGVIYGGGALILGLIISAIFRK